MLLLWRADVRSMPQSLSGRHTGLCQSFALMATVLADSLLPGMQCAGYHLKNSLILWPVLGCPGCSWHVWRHCSCSTHVHLGHRCLLLKLRVAVLRRSPCCCCWSSSETLVLPRWCIQGQSLLQVAETEDAILRPSYLMYLGLLSKIDEQGATSGLGARLRLANPHYLRKDVDAGCDDCICCHSLCPDTPAGTP